MKAGEEETVVSGDHCATSFGLYCAEEGPVGLYTDTGTLISDMTT